MFPVAAGLLYLGLTRSYWRRLGGGCSRFPGSLLLLAIAAPWHVLATLRNPPYFDFTMHSEAGSYRGFFWFYFINEHVLRFLNLRYPRDYNTVPRLYFWLFHLLWLFPWSVYLPAALQAEFRPAGPRRRGCGCWPVLGRIPAGLLHVLDHAGILFDAVLSGAGAADRLRRSRAAASMAAVRHAGDRGGRDAGAGGDRGDSDGWCAASPRPATSRRR